MSMIKDSELSWSCNEDYYVNTAGTVLSTHGTGSTQLTKTNNGGAIGVEIKLENSSNQLWYGPMIISTVELYARYTPSDSTPTKRFTINGVTWYVSIPSYWGQNQEDTNHLLPYLDLNEVGVDQEYIDDIGSDSALECVARLIIQAAELTIVHKLPSAGYLNKFVKRALIKNNEHIVSLIPDLDYDADPTEDSNNLLTSGVIYDALKKQLFAGTHAEVAAAILNGDIKDGTTILYTDDILDLAPTENSDNFISSGSIYNALKKLVFTGTHAEVETALANNVIDENSVVVYTDETDTIDSVPTENSTNMVTSGGIHNFVKQEFTNRIGNITIADPCTQTEYDAMTSHDPNTLYIVLPG